MKIIHTADLHIGQVIYQNYSRTDEHDHFFSQLGHWCMAERPDALLVSGDVFDIQQPGAAVTGQFNDYFITLHNLCPDMDIIITAGNHDSASRLEAEAPLWHLAKVHVFGTAPSVNLEGEELERYIVELPSGFIVALPYMTGDRREQIQTLLDKVAEKNSCGKPVVLMGHLAVAGSDMTGHGEIGAIQTQSLSSLGKGYDYAALGHIHKPQTLGHQEDALTGKVSYPSGVARYSGSALHVSCDEAYPHTVSVVEIPSHGAEVNIRQLRINELRHFYTIPEDGGCLADEKQVLEAVRNFARKNGKGYFRLRLDYNASLPSNLDQLIYDSISAYGDNLRYNPKPIWTGQPMGAEEESRPVFEVADLQQMSDPLEFIEKTIDNYPGLDLDMVKEAFKQVRKEIENEN